MSSFFHACYFLNIGILLTLEKIAVARKISYGYLCLQIASINNGELPKQNLRHSKQPTLNFDILNKKKGIIFRVIALLWHILCKIRLKYLDNHVVEYFPYLRKYCLNTVLLKKCVWNKVHCFIHIFFVIFRQIFKVFSRAWLSTKVSWIFYLIASPQLIRKGRFQSFLGDFYDVKNLRKSLTVNYFHTILNCW